jgi:molybdopterin-containing oxidoreductase family membrane subunit
MLYHPALGKSRAAIGVASALVIIGGIAQMYIIIIGGQAYPLSIFPNHDVVSSTFYDGVVASYTPSLYEVALGIGGIAIALALTMFVMKVLPFLPESLADDVVDPHHTKVETTEAPAVAEEQGSAQAEATA